MQATKKQALRLRCRNPFARSSRPICPFRVPGQGLSRYPGEIGLLLGLFRLLGLLRLLRLLRFLSHSILSGLNGLNATPRHAWRRASLATSSIANSADSLAAAVGCHAAVITLSTAVMRFRRVFATFHITSAPGTIARIMLNGAQTRGGAPSSSIQNHGMDCRVTGQSPLSGAAASCPQDNGDCHRRSALRAGGGLQGRRGRSGLGQIGC